MSILLLVCVVLPAVLAGGVTHSGAAGRAARMAAPWAAVPALALSFLEGGLAPALIPWLLDGAVIGLDLTGRIFLFLTSLLWTVAGIFAAGYLTDDKRRNRFLLFFLLSMCGNLGLTAALDVISFYLFFALMTFAAYGLIVHSRSAEAMRAGRVYITMAIAGEGMVVAGLILAVAAAGGDNGFAPVAQAIIVSPHRDTVMFLLLGGFGIKAGALPLHVWLPLAHPVAPTPASAVLSGSMIKAGLLGWIRLLPLGVAPLEHWGVLVLIAGLVSAFFGVLVGATQRDAKTTLAYSSISQMGIINVAIGIALIRPSAWPAALTAILVYALHHGLAKGALFLGTGIASAAVTVSQQRAALAGLFFLSLTVAGAPLTSGATAKAQLETAVAFAPGLWSDALDLLLPLTVIGTTLLMVRFLVLVIADMKKGTHPSSRPLHLWLPWLTLIASVAFVLWLLPLHHPLELAYPELTHAQELWHGVWPIVVGLVIGWAALMISRRRTRPWPQIAPGDLLFLVQRPFRSRSFQLIEDPDAVPKPVVSFASRWYGIYAESDRTDAPIRMEIGLTRWEMAVVLFVTLIITMFLLVWYGSLP